MPTPEWTHMIAEVGRLVQRREHIGRKATALAYKQAAAHHPETAGHPLLVHNWGNDAAKAVWAREAKRVSRACDYVDREYHRLWKAATAAEQRAA